MKKYIYIFKSEIMSDLQYISNIFIGFIGYFILIFIFLNLWQYIYSNPNEIINGYTMNQMIWYVMVTEVLWSVTGGRKLCHKICDDVKCGNIAYNMNKPYSYIGYALSSHLGSSFVKSIIYIILSLILGLVLLGSFPNISMFSIISVLLTGFLSVIISNLLVICIGLFSFFIEDSTPFYWLYSKIILIIGTIFPIEYFPKAIQPLLNFSPIFVTTYGPAKLFVNYSFKLFTKIIIFQLIWIFISYGLCLILYKKGVKKLNVNGG